MIQQPPTTTNVTIANGAATSGAFRLHEWLFGTVFVPDSWTDANIGFKVCAEESGTYVVAKDSSGSPLQISGINTTTGAAYALPTSIFAFPYVKLWSKNTTAATETDNNQTGAKILTVFLK